MGIEGRNGHSESQWEPANPCGLRPLPFDQAMLDLTRFQPWVGDKDPMNNYGVPVVTGSSFGPIVVGRQAVGYQRSYTYPGVCRVEALYLSANGECSNGTGGNTATKATRMAIQTRLLPLDFMHAAVKAGVCMVEIVHDGNPNGNSTEYLIGVKLEPRQLNGGQPGLPILEFTTSSSNAWESISRTGHVPRHTIRYL